MGNNIKDALRNRCSDGDRLLIHDGIYDSDISVYSKGFHLIGLGQKVFLKNNRNRYYNQYYVKCKSDGKNFRFENIQFDELSLCIYGNNKKIVIKNCSFRGCKSQSVIVKAGPMSVNHNPLVHLDVDHCLFVDNERGLCLNDRIHANVTNCLFKRCGKIQDYPLYMNSHSIMIDTYMVHSNADDTPMSDSESDKDENDYDVSGRVNTQLKCTGNIFEDVPTHPIVQHDSMFTSRVKVYSAMDDDGSERYLLKNNKLKGNNKFKGQIFHPNMSYRAK